MSRLEFHNRKKLLKTLCCEIKKNEDTARLNIEGWGLASKFDDLYKFRESAFKTIWLSGEISNIPSKLLSILDGVYSDMNKFNNNEIRNTPELMCKDIRESLLHLLETFCKEI